MYSCIGMEYISGMKYISGFNNNNNGIELNTILVDPNNLNIDGLYRIIYEKENRHHTCILVENTYPFKKENESWHIKFFAGIDIYQTNDNNIIKIPAYITLCFQEHMNKLSCVRPKIYSVKLEKTLQKEIKLHEFIQQKLCNDIFNEIYKYI